MNNNEKGSFILIDKDGNEKKYDVLFTFESEENGKNYIAYTDNTKDDNGKLMVYASTYNPNSDDLELQPLETDKEWKVIETILNTLQEEMLKAMKGENNEQ